MEQTRIPPQVGKYKVFIIDEVHMLTTQAFNAFLKTLEEPPSHVIFILATTEKHKILPTILSRCQIYDFERMTVKGTVEHLKYVAEKEGISYEEEALAVIAEKADGGMRDALSVFDQAASFCQGNITYKKVIEDLNVMDADNYFRIIDLSLENKVSDIMVLLNNAINKGFDGGLLIGGLAKHVRNVLMARDEATLPLLEVSEAMRQRYAEQAKRCTPAFLFQALRYMNQCDVNYRQSSNKRLLVELTLIEVAQITQPDDQPVAGRRPKRLKSLFNRQQPKAQPQQRAPQVAQEVTTAAKKKPKLVLNGITNSWNNIRKTATEQSTSAVTENFTTNTQGEEPDKNRKVFTQQELDFQWMSMCNRMPQDLVGIATRMKNMHPEIGHFPNVVVAVENQLVLDQLLTIQGQVLATLRRDLNNNEITLNIYAKEKQEQAKILSRREMFEEMKKNNPAIAKLQQLFDLELA